MRRLARPRPLIDERVVRPGQHRIAGFLGPISSSFTLAWLASHHERMRTLILGSKRLSVLVIWDTRGSATQPHSDADVAAITQLTYGDDDG